MLGVIIGVLLLCLLYAGYAGVVYGLVVVLRKMRVSSKKAILLSFLLFGAGAGFFLAWLWPNEGSFILNIPAAFSGDEIYILSIRYFGDPSSAHAHDTIPWMLRIPQVYVIASIIFWGLIGLLVQLARNKRVKRSKPC